MSREKLPTRSDHRDKQKRRPTPGFTFKHSEHEIKSQEANLELIKDKKPYITQLFQKSELLKYLGKDDPSVAAHFINTYFYGLLAKESSFGTTCHHLKTASRQVLTKEQYKSKKTLPGTKIPMKTYKQWRVERNKTGKWPKDKIEGFDLSYREFLRSVIKISYYQVKGTEISPRQFKKFLKRNPVTGKFITPESEFKKYGIKSHEHLKQLVQTHYIDKSPFQLIGNTLKDIREVLSRKKVPRTIKNIWSSKSKPTRKHLENFNDSAKLSVINLERIYQYCKPELDNPYLKKRKKGIVIPVILMCYLAGMGKAKEIFQLAIKKKYTSKPLETLLTEAKNQNIIKADRLNYIQKIRGYAFQIAPPIKTPKLSKSTEKSKAKAKESIKSQTQSQLASLKTETEKTITREELFAKKPTEEITREELFSKKPTKKITREELFDNPPKTRAEKIAQMFKDLEQIAADIKIARKDIEELQKQRAAQETIKPLTWGEIFDMGKKSLQDLPEKEVEYFVIDTFEPTVETTAEYSKEIYPFGVTITTSKNAISTTKPNNLVELIAKTPIGKYPTRNTNPKQRGNN